MGKRTTLEELRERVKFINPNLTLLNDELPKKASEKELIIYCDKCGTTNKFSTNRINCVYSYLKTGRKETHNWCPVCNNQLCVPGVNDIATIRKDLVQYFVDPDDATKYTRNSHKYTMFKCPQCNCKKKMTIYNIVNYKFSCPICSEKISYPNKVGRLVLTRLPVEEYDIEYEDDWTQGKIYDGYFLLNNTEYLLEFDGEQHYKDSKWTKVEEQQANDKYKDQLARDNNYKLIRINCKESSFEYIKNSFMNSELSQLFDLSLLNWDEIQKLANDNTFLSVIDYYKDHPEKSRAEIAKHFNLCTETIGRYIRKASDLNIIDYKYHKYKKDDLSFTFDVYDNNNNVIKEFDNINKCIEYLNKNTDYKFSYYQVNRHLKTGTEYNGFLFKFKEVDLNKWPFYESTKRICDYFLANQSLTTIEIANNLHKGFKNVQTDLLIGINIGLIDITKLEPCAFKHGRFCKYKPKEVA